MTPAARIEAAIELLAQTEALQRPADSVVSEFMRARRFMGAKDRRRVGDLVFSLLRARARLQWWIALAEGHSPNDGERAAAEGGAGARALVLAGLALIEGHTREEIGALFDGGQYHPAALEAGEAALLDALCGQALTDPRQADWVRLEVPAWLLSELAEPFASETETELSALNAPAPLDLRVNPLLADSRDSVMEALASEGLTAAPTPLSPLGLRVEGRRAMTASATFRQGLIELQDEGSQLVALLVGAEGGMAVCDLCAGAGGKTLALSGAMRDQGRLVALDSNGRRLRRAGPRLARAGAHNVERRMLADDDDPWLGEQAESFDRVLVDAPCSGVGAWRRQPDARWRLTPRALEAYVAIQDHVLRQAAGLVRPGGRLVYATCSLLPRENRARVQAFLGDHGDFEPMAIEDVWAETIGGSCPAGAGGADLTLTPARHGTDGFYVAVLRRREAA